MQTMFHYFVIEHVSYAREKEKISHPVDFTVFYITRRIFLCTLHNFWPTLCIGIYLKIFLHKLDQQLAINVKSLWVLVLALWLKWSQLIVYVIEVLLE